MSATVLPSAASGASQGRLVTILGLGPSSMERRWDILRYCEGSEIWCLNNGYHQFAHLLPPASGSEAKVSRWFELHSWSYLRTWQAGVPDHFAKLDSLGIPVFVSEPLPKIRRQVLVDWVKVFRHFIDGTACNYFLGSPSLMLALALYEHDIGAAPLSGIQSWGIDTSDPQHKQQRSAWAYWTAQAHARRIPVGGTMPEFMTEPDLDAGLSGLRELIGQQLERGERSESSSSSIPSVQPPEERTAP